MGLVSAAARTVIGLIVTLLSIWIAFMEFLLAILYSIIRITDNIFFLVDKTVLTVKQRIFRTTNRIFALHPVRIVRNVVRRIFKIVQQNIIRPIFAFLRSIGHRILKIIGKTFEPIFEVLWKIVEPIFEVIQTTAEPILGVAGVVVLSMMKVIQNIINRISRVKVVQNIDLLKVKVSRKVYGKNYYPRIPPGPLGLPILGHLHLMGDNMGEALLEWKEVYGPMISVRFGSFNAVVFNDFEIMKDCFQRPTCSGGTEVAYFKDAVQLREIIFDEQDDLDVELLEYMRANMSTHGVEANKLEDFMRTEILFLINFVSTKDGYSINTRELLMAPAINPFWSSLNRQRFRLDDQALKTVADICEGTLGLPTGVEKFAHFIPWLGRLLPCQPCQSGYKSGRRRFRELVQLMKEETMAGLDESHVSPHQRNVADAFKNKDGVTLDENSCFFKTKNNRPYSFCDELIGAIDTTWALMEWALLYLAVHTNVQRMLQQQIKKQLNKETPSRNDRQRIPFAEAIFYEIIRSVPLVTMNFGREALGNVEFRSYTIPQGTMLVANFYGLCMDKDVWGDPENFRPLRFIDSDGKLDIGGMIPLTTESRDCLLSETVMDQFFLVITSLFQKFNVTYRPGKVTLEKKSIGKIVHPDHSNELVFSARRELTIPEGHGFGV